VSVWQDGYTEKIDLTPAKRHALPFAGIEVVRACIIADDPDPQVLRVEMCGSDQAWVAAGLSAADVQAANSQTFSSRGRTIWRSAAGVHVVIECSRTKNRNTWRALSPGSPVRSISHGPASWPDDEPPVRGDPGFVSPEEYWRGY